MIEGKYQGWTVVFKSGTDYEADLVRDRLDDAGIPAVVLTQRDHAFNLNIGDLARVNVLVPPERAEEAVALLESEAMTDAEMDEAALSADPVSGPAHDEETEAMLDSGIESIRLTPPDEEEDDMRVS
jgi:hypothetical protein